MPRVYTKTKSSRGRERRCGRCGKTIAPGERYFTWSFRYGGDRFACAAHRPRSSELTQSLMADVYAAQEAFEDSVGEVTEVADLESLVDDVATAAEDVAQQYRDAAEPFGGQGENAERADELEEWVGQLQNFSPDEDDLEAAKEEAADAIGECPL